MKCKAITLYLWGLKIREVYQSDVLIIGSGIAGLSSAIHISQLRPDLKITIVSKTTKEEGNTRYAQGGISAVWNLEEDSFEKHIADTLDAGDDLCDQRIVRLVVEEGPTRVKELIDWGANFDKSATTGAYDLAREGGHSEHRILHFSDLTGAEIERTLLQKIKLFPNIKILEHYFAIDVITQHHLGYNVTRIMPDIECYGAYLLDHKSIGINWRWNCHDVPGKRARRKHGICPISPYGII